MDGPSVLALYTAGHAGAPMQAHDWLDLVPGVGVAGDRYALGRGHWSDPRWPDQEVTLIEAEVAAALGVAAGSLRRNIVTRDIDLATLIGHSFRAGTAELEGVRECAPCLYLETFTRPGIARDLAGRGGLRARVLRAGRIAVGDPLRIETPAKHPSETTMTHSGGQNR